MKTLREAGESTITQIRTHTSPWEASVRREGSEDLVRSGPALPRHGDAIYRAKMELHQAAQRRGAVVGGDALSFDAFSISGFRSARD